MSVLEAAPTFVSDRVKRRYRRMIRATMVKGKWAMENGNRTEEHRAYMMYLRAKKWMHLTRMHAMFARALERRLCPNKPQEATEQWYRQLDLAGPSQNNFESEDDWLQSLENYFTTADLAEIFPELSPTELDEFEYMLVALGYNEEDMDWAVGLGPTTLPWRRPNPDDEDEQGGGAGMGTPSQPLQVFMMQGGGGATPTTPSQTKQYAAISW